MIPPGTDVASIAPLIDGWVIPGGGDFDSEMWGEELHPEAQPEFKDRTDTEVELFRSISPETPILGICYGCQLVNILQGGTIHQHIPDQLGHDGHRGDPVQVYRVEAGTKLHDMVGDSARGKSWHHQAVNRVGDGLKAVAWHEDGTIEAIESTDGRWFVGLQWHPERTEVDESEKIFVAFIKAVIETKKSKIGVRA
ncbi:MAG: gamma-glutamyl-gamma-aminobutyrate hydrolase family protein [Fimbriimonadaceae bacterium]